MNSSDAPGAEGFRARVREFLAAELPAGWRGVGTLDAAAADAFAERWRATLFEHGFLAPSWPAEYGGAGLTPLEQVVLAEEFARVGVPTGVQNDVFSIVMIGNTLLHWGTEEQKRHFLPRILSGEDRWCQGYSEPGAGSDLAGLSARAEIDGDEWVINGQKIWTSGGQLANWIFVLVRTDQDAPAHRGISLLLVPMDQPGVEVRPIRNMAGDSDFNEVFFTDARCPRENVVGEVDGGWKVAMTLLGYERGEAAAILPIMFRIELDRLLDLARENGAAEDPVLRDRLADAYIGVEVMRFMGMASLARFLQGHPPGPDAAVSKLYWSEYHQKVTELALDVLDVESLVVQGRRPTNVTMFQTDDVGAPNDSASWITTAMVSRSGTIYAGTSEIQKTIIGEKLLGLPK
ncbi:acyl-CoA dehydrogenase family protein [Actinomadura viridis]|uniref:Alkylation response protein AidB-like acyl-CoA dehydrogenase n=1 Tax=Actinomadura viridis TaxID=58110 RepID=A0A931DN87_9ACTN|nr:acyl-CoA dehydrogenase family protein [Actinomadura viridis]MBG6093070.1 alkylation response protein AidB-like acyl-CoA dehydrogenase [Actinomadura viridis]